MAWATVQCQCGKYPFIETTDDPLCGEGEQGHEWEVWCPCGRRTGRWVVRETPIGVWELLTNNTVSLKDWNNLLGNMRKFTTMLRILRRRRWWFWTVRFYYWVKRKLKQEKTDGKGTEN